MRYLGFIAIFHKMKDNRKVENLVESPLGDSDQVLRDGMCVVLGVSVEFEPKLGVEFDTLDNVYNLYNMYANKASFAALINSIRKSTYTREILWKAYVCYKEGRHRIQEDHVSKKR